MVLEVPWKQFQGLELWQIRSRAFVTGESVVAGKIEQLDALMNARAAWAGKKPRESQQEFEQYYLKAITVEQQLTPKQSDECKRKHNQSFFDELKAQHHGG